MRLFLNYILIPIVFLYNSSCHSISEANLSLVSTDENRYNNNYELPKILYKGEFKYVIPQKRWVAGKVFFSVDTLLSRLIENHIRDTRRFAVDAIYKFHVRLKIDDKGNVFSVNEIGDDLSFIFNDKELKKVFINDIFEYIKTISFLPAQINNKNVSCEIDLYLHINPYGLANSKYSERDHQGSVRMVRNNSFGVAQSTAYTASGLPVTHIYSGTGDWHLHTGKPWQDIGGLAWYDNRARWYDPITMRFLAPDPLADKFHDISPWTWCGNNPLRYSDPTGKEINYPNDVGFNLRLKDAINYIGKESFDAFMNPMRESENVYKVVDGRKNGKHFAVDTKIGYNTEGNKILVVEISIDLYSAIKLDDDNIISPALSVYHEFGHAARTVNDIEGYTKDIRTTDSEYDTKKERRVITTIENIKAKELKEPLRNNHRFLDYWQTKFVNYHMTQGKEFVP